MTVWLEINEIPCEFVRPAFLKPVYKAWMTLGLCMGHVMSRVLLTILFYLVFAPIGIYLRLTGKDLMQRTFARDEKSYWKDHAERDKVSYEKQF